MSVSSIPSTVRVGDFLRVNGVVWHVDNIIVDDESRTMKIDMTEDYQYETNDRKKTKVKKKV